MAYYYPRTIQNVTTSLLSKFTNVKVYKYDRDGNQTQEIPVPLRWGPVDKHRDIRELSESERSYYQSYPRMAMTGPTLQYNAERATDSNGVRHHYSKILGINDDDFYSDTVPAPYDYTYTLTIRSYSMDFMNQILENILPYFNPSIYLRVREFSFLDIERDLRVTLESGIDPVYDPMDQSDEGPRRMVEVVMTFRIEGFMYTPISTTKIIKIIDSQYFINNVMDTSASADDSLLIDSYSTSGFPDTSAFSPLVSGFSYSAYDDVDDIYIYTSAF